FIVDSGSDINIIKTSVINSNLQVNTNHTLSMQGISPEPVKTLGSVTITLLGKPTEFHLAPYNFGFPNRGILGSTFFKLHNANIDY
ncbi:Retrovirus-related Pol polyprotein from transposon 412, partial [Harpegnathos saltator]